MEVDLEKGQRGIVEFSDITVTTLVNDFLFRFVAWSLLK